MKTMTFTLNIPNTTIKDRILNEISIFDKQKQIDKSNFDTMYKMLSILAKDICNGLNQAVGETVWIFPTNGEYKSKRSDLGKLTNKNLLTIGLYLNPIYRNTTTNTFVVYLGFEYKEVFREGKSISDYHALTDNQEIEIYFADDSKSSSYKKNRVFTKITDLNDVHELAKVGYKQYFDNAINK